MRLDDRMGLGSGVLAEVTAFVESQGTLEDVVRWALGSEPPCGVAAIVVQDEYTHDVVVAWRPGIYLVYDTT